MYVDYGSQSYSIIQPWKRTHAVDDFGNNLLWRSDANYTTTVRVMACKTFQLKR